MPGQSKQTQKSDQTTSQTTTQAQDNQANTSQTGFATRTPFGGAYPILTDIIRQAGSISPFTSEVQDEALSGLRNVSGASAAYAPQVQGVLANLFSGGGFGEGSDAIRSNYALASDQLSPIASGKYLDQSNPYLQGILGQITDNARNAVGGQFAKAGRSFSGAHADATAGAITRGTAPALFDQFNMERGRQVEAINNLSNLGFLSGGALDDTAARTIGAQTTGAGLLPGYQALMEQPYRTQFEAASQQQRVPLDQFGILSNIVLPIASTFADTQTGTTGQSTGQASSTGSMEGQQFGTTTTTQKQNPLQTALGAALGIGGLLMGNPAGGLGLLSSMSAAGGGGAF